VINSTINPKSDKKSTITQKTETWQQVISREWRNCDDEEYAEHLFDLVANETLDWQATVVSVFIGTLFGIIGGCLITLLLYPTSWSAGSIILGLSLGAAVGSLGGWLVMLGLRWRQQALWGVWLQGLIPGKPLVARLQDKTLNSLFFMLMVGFGSGLGAGMTSALFFGQPNQQFYTLLIGAAITAIAGYFSARQIGLIDIAIGVTAGLMLGLFFGLGFAQFVEQFVDPLDIYTSAGVVGLAVGGAVGLYLGRWGGLIILLAVQVILLLIIFIVASNIALTGWLFGVLTGGLIAGISKMLAPGTAKPNFTDAYAYRPAYLWWLRRPPATQVEAALRLQTSQTMLLRRLEEKRKQSNSPKQLINDLNDNNWRDRFLARHILVTLGGEAIPALVTMLPEQKKFIGSGLLKDETGNRFRPLKQIAIWLVRSIVHETTNRLAHRAGRMICPTCLTCCGPHKASLPGLSVTYYGCRTCQQSREFLDCSEGVTAVLDDRWSEVWQHQDGLLRVNWLICRKLFDFDRVEVIQATDEDVERFVVQVGNDTDVLRQTRYPQIQCLIGPACRLSENSLRILERTFGRVESA
jgi:hypothetical protein